MVNLSDDDPPIPLGDPLTTPPVSFDPQPKARKLVLATLLFEDLVT